MRRIISAVCFFALLFLCPGQAASLGSLPKDFWAYPYYDYMLEHNYIPSDIGTAPDKLINRQTIIDMLSAMTVPSQTALEAILTEWDEVSTITEASAPVSRQEAAVLAVGYLSQYGKRVLKATEAPPAFRDAGDVSVWAEDAIEQLVEAGILEGNGDYMLYPQKQITEAECMKLFSQASQKGIVYPGQLPILNSKITVNFQSGTTGAVMEITGDQTVADVLAIINEGPYSFVRKENIPASGGWSKRITIYRGSSVVFDYIINSGSVSTGIGRYYLDQESEAALSLLLPDPV